MKLVILAQYYLLDKTSPINGTVVQLYNLAHGFTKRGLEVHYVCLTKDKLKPEYDFDNNIHFYFIQRRPGVLNWKKTMKDYDNLIHKINPDAIYVRGRNVMQYVAGTYAKEKEVSFVWGTNGEDSAEFWKNVKRLKSSSKSLLRKLALLPFKAYEDIYINKGMKLSKSIVNQSTNQQEATSEILNKKGQVLPSYFYLPPQEETLKQNTILWFANLSKAKQPDLFIDIIKKVNIKNWKVILAGGTKVNAYQNHIEVLTKNTNIKTLGKVAFKDSFQYYQQAKIYINTSKPGADGLPNAFIQSWLSGTIVLSLHHDPNTWMQTHNIGYCSHGDLNDLAFKLQKLIDNPQLLSQMSHNAKLFAKHQFSNDEIIESYIKLFKNNAGRK